MTLPYSFRGYELECAARNHGALWEGRDTKAMVDLINRSESLGYISKELGRTERAIVMKAEQMGLTIPKEKVTVNLHHLITLAQKGYTTVNVVFSGDGSSESRFYTYKVSDSVAKTLAPNDLVVVEANKAMKVAKVKEVHEEPQIDVRAPFAFAWVVQKVDRTAYDQQVQNEDTAVKMLEQGERRKAQKEALDTLLGSVDREEFMRLMNAV
jgi:hypothetical protein